MAVAGLTSRSVVWIEKPAEGTKRKHWEPDIEFSGEATRGYRRRRHSGKSEGDDDGNG